MKKILIYIMVLLAALSCREKAEYDQTLGLLSRYNVLSANGGSTQVAVFSNTAWTVEFDHPVSWAYIDRFSGYKSSYLVFTFDVNYGRSRRVDLVFKAGGQTRTLSMWQNPGTDDGNIKITGQTSVLAPKEGTTVSAPISTNLVYSLEEMYLSISYPDGNTPETPWITLLGFKQNPINASDIKMDIQIAPNESGAIRIADIYLCHTDAGEAYDSEEGDTITSTNKINVVQMQ